MTSTFHTQIYYSRLISAGISIIGIAVIFITYIFAYVKQKVVEKQSITAKSQSSSISSFEKANKIKFSHNIIFLISLSDLLCCIAAFLDTTEDLDKKEITPLCKAQAFLYNFSEISTICLTTGLSLIIYLGTFHKKRFNILNNYFLWIVLYGFTPALILSIIPIPLDLYNPAGEWCWIKSIHTKNGLIFGVIIFCFNWVNMLINIYVIIKTYFFFRNATIRDSESEENISSLKQFSLFLITFPSILVICWFFPTLNRLSEIITSSSNPLYIFGTAIAMSSMGFLNSIVYFLFYFKDYYTCCKKNQSLELLVKPINVENSNERIPHLKTDDESDENN